MFTAVKNVMIGKPILAIFDVTKLCNQRCPMCNIWKTQSDDMTLQEIETCAQSLSSFGIRYVFVQGGEPTLRKDLVQLLDIFLKHKIKPTVITNGILLKRELASQIAERKCNLAISIDSLDKERFHQLRGIDILEKVMANIEAIADLPHKGNWAITTTVSAMSGEDDIFAIEKYAHRYNFMHAIRPYIFVKGTAGRKVEEMTGDQEKLLRIFEKYIKTARQYNYIASLIYEEHINYIKGKPMPSCDAMKYSMLLKENGAIAPCIEFPHIELSLDDFRVQQKKWANHFKDCNAQTPCFYNDAREIGILWRKKWRAMLHFPQITMQLFKYGNFF